MIRTQQEINNLYQQFRAAYPDGTRIDYAGQYPGECLSKEKRWLDTLRNGYVNGPMAAPASTNGFGDGYWLDPPAMVTEFFDPQPYNPNGSYPLGSLFVYTKSGHIGTLLDNQPGQPTALVYQQNADPEGSGAHTAQRGKARIDGILVIRVAQPAVHAPYTPTTDGFPKHLQLVRTTHEWDCNRTDFNDRAAHPIQQYNEGYDFVAQGLYTTQDGNKYYSPDMQNSGGFHIGDCDWYKAPAPVYTPPAAPVTAPLAEKYELITTVVYFPSAQDAKERSSKALGTIDAGTYIVVGRDEQAVKLSKDNRTDIGWINTFDNKIEEPKPVEVLQPAVEVQPTLPVDAPATDINLPVDLPAAPITEVSNPLPTGPKPQYNWIREDRLPVRLTSTNTLPVQMIDLEGKWPSQKLPAKKTEEYSMYADVDGTRYFIMERCRVHGWMFGVSENFLPKLPKATAYDRNANGKYDIVDVFEGFIDFGSKHFKQAVTTSAPKIEQVRQRTTKFIDGFSARKKQ
jgi:hypothetical protein